jgi:cellulose synthase/poly-beta-1,6-N-acetylglucosamine synthase-like glycosyltransferase
VTAALDLLAALVGAIYGGAGLALAALGLHALLLAALRTALPRRALPADDTAPWPDVVVQLPVYDEPPHLVARALDAALAADYPGRVEIQLLDDSPPAVRRANAALCAERRPGVRHLPRAARDGYKAGALAHGLARSDAPVVAVFDVDFRPPPDALRRLVAALRADPGLAFVQGRWAHPGADRTPLGRAQAAVLDLHFAVEQTARDRAVLALPFNGSGGVWRRAAIDAAGGWRADTLAEDADLALRAQAAGWRARLAENVAVPADLPATVGAWRRQQARWAKGLAEVARLRLGALWGSGLPIGSKLAFTGHLALSLSLPSLLVVILLHPVMAALGTMGAGAAVAAVLGPMALTGVVVAHVVALRAVHPDSWRGRLARVPAALAAPVVLVVPAARAVAEAVVGRRTPFARTPKGGRGEGEAGLAEIALAAYSVAGLVGLAALGAWGGAAFQALLAVGTVGAAWSVRRAAEAGAPVAEMPAVRAAA